MTTVAYRDGILCADTLKTCNGLRDDYGTKIFRVGPVLIGGAGPASVCLRFRDWVADGMEGDSPFMGEDGNGLLISESAVICFSVSGCYPIKAPFYSLGSGYQIALGAMDQGASAEEAVRAAIRWDTSSGGDVTVLHLKS